MWVRKLGRKGDGLGLTLPPEVLKAFGWERGDHLHIRCGHRNVLEIIKLNLAVLPDRVREALKPERVIRYGRKHRKHRA
jgi:bifunctional DNA-binding transcriptional regulator/antitoxin component of YhaV-PrlF toxin-antitoxin module